MKKFCCFIVIALACVSVFCTTSVGQDGETESKENGSKRIIRVVDKRGWALPGIDDLKTENVRSIMFEGKTVSLKSMTPNRRFDSVFQAFFIERDGGLVIHPIQVRLLGFNSFEVAGKRFAVQVYFGIDLDQSDGSTSMGGSAFRIFYYDEDGDGIFETRYENKKELDHFPKWLVKTA